MTAASLVVLVLIAAYSLKVSASIVLDLLNIRFLQRGRGTVSPELDGILDADASARATEYAITKLRFHIISEGFQLLLDFVVILSGILGYADHQIRFALSETGAPNQYLTGILLSVVLTSGALLVNLPFSYYQTFNIEAAYGFNRSTRTRWVIDQLLGLSLSAVFISILLSALLLVMQLFPTYWWIVGIGVVAVFMVVIQIVFPTLIAPLFNEFRPLRSSELEVRITEMCANLKFPLSGVYEIDGSKRSTKANAFVAGLWKSKRIALFDTLLSQLSHEQILAVLAHEIGHSKLKHAAKTMLFAIPRVVVMFWIMSLLVGFTPLFSAFGVQQLSNYMALILSQLALEPFMFWLGPLGFWLSRKHEYEADRFAAEAMASAEPLATGLIALTKSNATSPKVHPTYAAFHDSHPRLIERLAALRLP